MAHDVLIDMLSSLSLESGSATDYIDPASVLLVDNTKNWPSNKYKDCMVRIIYGKGAGQQARIIANGSDSLQVASPWIEGLDTTSVYVIHQPEVTEQVQSTLQEVQSITGKLENIGNILNLFKESAYGSTVYYDETGGFSGTAFPTGTANRPCSSETDVVAICARENIRKIHISGNFTVPGVMKGFEFFGASFASGENQVDLNGQDVDGSTFRQLRVTGTQGGTGSIDLEDCHCAYLDDFQGQFTRCAVSTISLRPNGPTVLVDCTAWRSEVTIIDCNIPNSCNIYGFHGLLLLRNMTNGMINVFAGPGTSLDILPTCTGGYINVYGKLAYLTGVGDGVNLWIDSDLAQLGEYIYLDTDDGTVGRLYYPYGTASHPVGSLADVRSLSTGAGGAWLIKKVKVRGWPSIDADMKDWIFEGSGLETWNSGIELVAAFSIEGSVFKNLFIWGDAGSKWSFYENCYVDGLKNINAVFKNCVFTGNNSISKGRTCLIDCSSEGMTKEAEFSVDETDAMDEVFFINWEGSLLLKNIDDPLTVVNIHTSSGKITLQNTCTAGTINIYGNARVIDNSAGATVNVYFTPDIDETADTFSFDETDAGEQILATVTLNIRNKIGGIWLDMADVTRNTEIRVKHKINGTDYRTFTTLSWLTTGDAGVLVGPFTAYRDIQITLQCDGGGTGSVNVPYAIT